MWYNSICLYALTGNNDVHKQTIYGHKWHQHPVCLSRAITPLGICYSSRG